MALILVTFQQHTLVIQALQTSLTLLFPLLFLRIAKYMELRALLVANQWSISYALSHDMLFHFLFSGKGNKLVIFYVVDDQ